MSILVEIVSRSFILAEGSKRKITEVIEKIEKNNCEINYWEIQNEN